MFTQCSKCETVFRLSADVLRAAGGQVRCGRCGEVFNALARLAENASGFRKGESSLFLENRAVEILESPLVDPVPDPVAEGAEQTASAVAAGSVEELDLPPGVEMAQLRFVGDIDDDLVDETSLEFTLPPGELDRIFIESRASPLQQLTADAPRGERHEVSQLYLVPTPAHPESMDAAAPVEEAQAPPAHPESSVVETVPPAPAKPIARVGPGATHSPPSPPSPPSPTSATIAPLRMARPAGAPLTRIAGLEVAEDVRQEMLSSYAYAELPRINDPVARLPLAVWISAAVLLVLLLGFQIARNDGAWLAAHLRLFGGKAAPAANLSVYQLRQWGVTGDPAAKGTLRVRASIMNTAPQLQPYPLLRVMLVNRFGTRIGAREFDSSEYLGRNGALMLAPGEKVDATLDILDPGKDAEGFEIDVCLRGADKKLSCAGDVAATPK